MNRRSFLTTSALIALPLALSACAAGASAAATITAQAASDIAAMNSVLQQDLPSISAIPGASADAALAGQVSTVLTKFAAAAASVVAGISANTAAPILMQASDAWTALSGAVTSSGLVLPTTLQEVFADVNILLPIVLAVAGVFVAGSAVRATVPVPATPGEARLDLKAKLKR